MPPVVRRIGGSLVVSLVTSALSLTVLGALTFADVVPAGVANVIATMAGIGPSYALNRRWVWRRAGRSSLRFEVGPFWMMCLLALVASTITVSAAAEWAASRELSNGIRTASLLAVNVVTFGLLWIVQFIALDRFLFHPEPKRGRGGPARSRDELVTSPATDRSSADGC